MSPAADLQNAHAVTDLFDRAADLLRLSAHRAGCVVHLPATGRLLATGDLHDNPIHLRKVIRLAALDASPDHHVTLHELIHSERLVNGVDLSYRVLAKVAQLVTDFPLQVHPLLANHEISQMTNVGVSKGAGDSVKLFTSGIDFVFTEDAPEVTRAVNGFIAAMPLALRSESGVFCAHSLPNQVFLPRFDRAVFERNLKPEDYRSPSGPAYQMTWGRGHTAASLDALAAEWNVRLFILGHEYIQTGIEARGSHAVILNTDHDRATVLPIDLQNPAPVEDLIFDAIPLTSVGE